MSELQQAREKIKSLEERNDVLEQYIIANREVRLLLKEAYERKERELEKIKTQNRWIWN